MLTQTIKATLELNGPGPTMRPYRTSVADRIVIRQLIEDLIRQRKMQVSNSQFSSPVNLVKKPHGDGYRLTCDYRKLNGSLVKGSYPLPLIDDLLASFSRSKWFTTIDLKNAFFQVPLETEMDRTG